MNDEEWERFVKSGDYQGWLEKLLIGAFIFGLPFALYFGSRLF